MKDLNDIVRILDIIVRVAVVITACWALYRILFCSECVISSPISAIFTI